MLEQITSEGPERCLKCGLVLASRDPAVPPSRDNCRGPDSRGCLRRQLAAEKRGRWIAERALEIIKGLEFKFGPYYGMCAEGARIVRAAGLPEFSQPIPADVVRAVRKLAEAEYDAEHGGEE